MIAVIIIVCVILLIIEGMIYGGKRYYANKLKDMNNGFKEEEDDN